MLVDKERHLSNANGVCAFFFLQKRLFFAFFQCQKPQTRHQRADFKFIAKRLLVKNLHRSLHYLYRPLTHLFFKLHDVQARSGNQRQNIKAVGSVRGRRREQCRCENMLFLNTMKSLCSRLVHYGSVHKSRLALCKDDGFSRHVVFDSALFHIKKLHVVVIVPRISAFVKRIYIHDVGSIREIGHFCLYSLKFCFSVDRAYL